MRQRVMIIEDEADIVEMVRYNFRKEGFEVESFLCGKPGVEALHRDPPDLLVLDIMLPDEDGFSICRRLRSEDRLKTLPVILLTARGQETDRILGFEVGADDYVVKPFSPRELVARAKAILRRGPRVDGPQPPVEVIEIRDLRLDPHTHDVVVRGTTVELSALEFRLLYFLASHQREIFSRERLLDEVWGRKCAITPRTVDVHIRRLREKIEPHPDAPEYIDTVRGAGYRVLAAPQQG
jgi:DNA-binding response OmpR family regulator